MVVSGGKQIAQGFVNEVDLLKRMLPGGDPLFKSDENEKPAVTSTGNTDNVNINGGAMGSGDVDNRVITQNSYVYNNTYGSGNRTTMNQDAYGSYMNMSERGCGPVALADAYSRRTGNNISPVSLASRMAGSGAYEPNRGTSVGSFIRTGNAMGMNMRVGGVTQASLKRATPNNPITLLGSGSDYGTRSGNDHYVNVIGTDRYGGAYVSNPLTGRVDRRSASTLALNSRLGLYGSGDSSDLFSFDANTTDAMTKLKNLTSRLTGMFTGESTSDSISRKINEGEEETQLNEIKRQLGEEYETKETEALEAFKSANPKRADESDEEYEHRISTLWDKPSVYRKYMIDFAGQAAIEKMDAMHNEMEGSLSYFTNDDEETGLRAFINKTKNVSSPNSGNGGTGQLSAPSGAQLYNFGKLTHTKTNITSSTSGESPLHDFFGAMTGSSTYSANGNWFQFRDNPNSEGVGSRGDTHGGVDFLWSDGSEGKELYATTGGVVTNAGFSESAGYNVQWRDSGGYHHWYMHMLSDPNVQINDTIAAGQLLGYVGNTGYSDGAHLHYTIKEKPGGYSSDPDSINPLTYFSVYSANNSSGSFVGNNDAEKVWNYLRSNGFTKEGAASVMGNFEAESGIRSNNLQNSYESSLGYNDDSYTAAVDNGSYTNFVHDSAGYGLGQWTYWDRKEGLYNYIKKLNASIGDLGAQLQYFVNDEMTNRYSGLYDELKTTTNISGSTERFMREFENPKDQSSTAIQGRVNRAQSIYDMYKDLVSQTTQSPTGKGSTLNGYGMVGGLGDLAILNNVKEIKTTGGKNSGTVATRDGDDLNLRQETNQTSAILATIPNGTHLDYLVASGTKGWYKTKHNGIDGYVSADFIALDESYLDNTKPTSPYTNYKPDLKPISGPQTEKEWKSSNSNTVYPQNVDSQEIIDKLYGDKDLSKRAERLALEKKIRNVIYDPSQWSTLEASERAILWDMLVDEHKKALNNVAYNGVYGNMTVTDHYYTGDDDEYWRYCYTTKDSRVNRQVEQMKKINNVAHSSGGGSHGGGLIGSGDVSSDFWYDSLFNNQSPFSQDIPPLDDTAFTDYDNTGLQPYRNIINRYEITSDDSNKTELLNKMSKMTFNVRAQRVEELLEELIEKVDGNKPKPTSNNSGTDLNLFKDNGIPEQVTRLSRG